MEHRHFPRKSVDVAIQVLTVEGARYQAHLLELSAIGMRVAVNGSFPEQTKLVDVLLPVSKRSPNPTQTVRMFVAHKHGSVLGLCLLNERVQFDVNRQQQGGMIVIKTQKMAS
jgi:hypothetical protein